MNTEQPIPGTSTVTSSTSATNPLHYEIELSDLMMPAPPILDDGSITALEEDAA